MSIRDEEKKHFNFEILTKHNMIKVSHIFDEAIERVYYFYTSLMKFKEIYKDFLSDVVCINGDPSNYSIGSAYNFTWKNSFSVRFIVENIINKPHFKAVQVYYYEVEPKEFRYRCIYKFYKNTVENYTYYSYDFIFGSPPALSFFQVNFNTDDNKRLLNTIDNFVYSNAEGLEQVESIILNNDIKKVWSIITDWKVFQQHVPIIADQVEYEKDCENKIVLIKLRFESDKTEYFLKVLKSNVNKYDGEYRLLLFTMNSSFPNQELFFNVISLNDNQCLLTFKHMFLTYVKPAVISDLSDNKKDILKMLKKSLNDC
jgi:hypothetical protein